jgi:copper homeostasis protein
MKKNFIIEICANTFQSAMEAQAGGADRVELCDNISEGGTTPSYGTIIETRKNLKIDLFVLIRPRGGDFLYTKPEFEIIKRDIEFCKSAKVNGIVTGILSIDGSIDINRTKVLVELASPLPVTFHRAFDMTKDSFTALEDIIKTGCKRVLTSGQEQRAAKGIAKITKIINQADDRIIIMPGSGINEKNILEIATMTGANEFHLSLRDARKSNMKYQKDKIKMSTVSKADEFEMEITSQERVKRAKEILNLKFSDKYEEN